MSSMDDAPGGALGAAHIEAILAGTDVSPAHADAAAIVIDDPVDPTTTSAAAVAVADSIVDSATTDGVGRMPLSKI